MVTSVVQLKKEATKITLAGSLILPIFNLALVTYNTDALQLYSYCISFIVVSGLFGYNGFNPPQ